MLRKRSDGISSTITRMTAQVLRLRNRLQQEIRSKEAELQKIKQQQVALSAFASGGTNGAQPRTHATRKRAARIDWSNVLKQMPKQFKASEVRKVSGLKDKRSSEIFAAITRWIEAGTVKRKDRGVYAQVK